MNRCQPSSPISYVYLETNPLSLIIFSETETRGRWRKRGREYYGARHMHEVPSNNERQGTLWILNKRRKVQWVVRANSGGTRVNMTMERGDIGNTSLSNTYLTATLIFIVHFVVQRMLKSSRIQRDEYIC